MSQVNRKGEKPVSSPALEEAIRRRKADDRSSFSLVPLPKE